MVRTLDFFSIEVATVERHSAVRTSVPHCEGPTRSVAPDYQRDLQQHCFMQLIALNPVRRQGAIPEAGEHLGVGCLALRGIEFGHRSHLR
jgi:hypothetical protein